MPSAAIWRASVRDLLIVAASIASAAAAAFSAYIAFQSWTFLPKQLNAARQQLQASYLVNLYGKQIDTLSLVQTKIEKLQRIALRDIAAVNAHSQLDFQSYQRTVQAHLADYDEIAGEMSAATHAATLVWPKNAKNTFDEVAFAAQLVANAMENVADTASDLKEAEKLTQLVGQQSLLLLYWNEAIGDCAQDLFSHGDSISQAAFTKCDIEKHIRDASIEDKHTGDAP